MTRIFLKAKHWQLFLLTFGIPMISQFAMTGTIVAGVGVGNDNDPPFILDYIQLFPFMMLLCVTGLFGWFWSVGSGLQSKVPAGVEMKVRKFKIFFFISLVYILLVLGLVMAALAGIGLNSKIFIIILPLHLISMFGVFYSLYFAAKTFKTVELQRETSFSDFSSEFFMMWFFPIGIWMIQPRINRIVKEG